MQQDVIKPRVFPTALPVAAPVLAPIEDVTALSPFEDDDVCCEVVVIDLFAMPELPDSIPPEVLNASPTCVVLDA